MALNQHHDTAGGRENPPRASLKNYFARYRLALYLVSGVVIVSGVALSWNWLTAAGLLPIIAFLPCMLMMFMCMRHGTRKSDEPTTLPPWFPTSSESQQ